MYAIEFQAHIRDGVIEIPPENRDELLSSLPNGEVRVIVLATKQKQSVTEDNQPSFLQQLLNNPLHIPDFAPMKREDIYERI